MLELLLPPLLPPPLLPPLLPPPEFPEEILYSNVETSLLSRPSITAMALSVVVALMEMGLTYSTLEVVGSEPFVV